MNTKLDFNQWYAQIQESIDAAPVKTESTVASDTTTPNVDAAIEVAPSKTEIIQDVDTIMNSLAKLSVQIKEALESLNVFENEEIDVELNEEEAILEFDTESIKDAGSKMADWIYYAPKYRTMQKKINKMKMNALDIQLAVDLLPNDAENKAKKDALKAKKTNMDSSIRDLQSEVDDKAKERGEYIGKVLSTEKIKGKMELVKRASGQEDDPAKKKELADSFKELNRRFAEEQTAIKKIQSKEKEKEAEKKTDTSKKEEPKKEEPAKEEPKKEESKPANKASELEANIKSYNENIAEERKSIEKAKEELKSEKDPEKIAKLKDSIQQSKEDIQEMQGEIKKLKDDFKKSAPAKESLLFMANELGLNEMATEIAEKQDWQFENNSALYIKYNTEIEKHSALKKINESTATSIADKFRMLLG